jgi:thiosulfate/3-mercaptopyruvate sulfurtransferase
VIPETISLEEVLRRRGEEGFVVVDVRGRPEYTGAAVAPCDPRPGRIPGAVHLDLQELMALTAEEIAERVGPAYEVELVTYCHSGQRSELAAQILRAAGYRASNYRGSWHEWSRDETLPAATG